MCEKAKTILRPAHAVCSTHSLVEIYNNGSYETFRPGVNFIKALMPKFVPQNAKKDGVLTFKL